jgi:hypothetical protein
MLPCTIGIKKCSILWPVTSLSRGATMCIDTRVYQKFPDWSPGARTANGTAFCHEVQFYRYFVSQSNEFCRHNPLCCFSTSVCSCCLFRYRLSSETFGYNLVLWEVNSSDHFISMSTSIYAIKFHYLQKFYKCKLNVMK